MKPLLLILAMLNLFLWSIPDQPVSRYAPECVQFGGERENCGNPCGCVV